MNSEWVDCDGVSVVETCLTYGHEIEVLIYTQARYFCWFVAWNGGENSGTKRISTVSLFKVPDLYLKKKAQSV